MEHGIYAHPWDLRDLADRGGFERLAQLGFTDLALATSYHAGRWLTPWSSDGLVRFLEDGVVHSAVSGATGGLQPQSSAEVTAGNDPLRAMCAAAGAAGLRAVAWTVLFHNSRLGRVHPELCIENAVGDRYDYGLCPAQPEVRAFGVALCARLGAVDGLAVLELEAAGFFGHKHGSHHDKASFATDRYTDFLLSYCFCRRCCEGIAAAGADADRARAAARAALRDALVESCAMQPPRCDDAEAELAEVFGADTLAAMLAHRRGTAQGFLRQVRAAVPAGVRLSLHVSPDPLATGSSLGEQLAVSGEWVDELVVTHYGQGPDRIAAAWRGRSAPPVPTRLAIWPKAPQFNDAAEVRAVAELAGEVGAAGLRVYHLGLLPWRTVEAAAGALR